MKRSNSNARQAAFTLVELLVVIGVIAILIAILMPALSRARQQAATVKCLSNLKQFGQAIALYANENKGFLVPGGVRNVGDTFDRENWATILVNTKALAAPSVAGGNNTIADESGAGPNVFRCPEGVDNRWGVSGNSSMPTRFDSGTGRQFTRVLSQSTNRRIDTWYGINGWSASDSAANVDKAFKRWPFTMVPGSLAGTTQRLHKLAEFKQSSDMVLIFDGLGFHQQQALFISARHNGRKVTNLLFADGHAGSIQSPGDIPMDGSKTLKVMPSTGPRFMLKEVP